MPARRRRRLLTAATLAAFALVAPLTAVTTASAAAGDDITDGLVARYTLDQTSGTSVPNSAPGSSIGPGSVDGAATWAGDGGGFVFSGGRDGSGNAIRLPNDINRGLSAISVDFDVFIAPEQANYYMIYGIGNRAGNGAGERYLFGSGDSFHTVITPGGQGQEINIQPSGNPTLARGLWKHMTYTQTGTTGILYEDGVERTRNTRVTTTPDQLGSTTFNHIGRSVYSWDPSFQGKVRDFRIYNRALTAAEVGTLAVDVLKQSTDSDAAAIRLGDLSAVTTDLALPAKGASGTTIAWATSNPGVVTASGVVTRGPEGSQPATATLTATVTRGSESTRRTFDVTVAPRDDAADARSIAAGLSIPRLGDVRENLTLPTRVGNASVVWSSTRPAVIRPDGWVTRPATGSPAATVELTATVTVGSGTATRTLTATVVPAPVTEETKAYLFPYFTGEANADDEKVRYAVSNGNNALDWVTVNNDRPVLESTKGQQGLRDPFVIRSPEGDRFYLLATDLNAYRNTLSQVDSSRYIEVWESTDLVTWSEQRHVLVSAPEAGNTWAPEAFYDPTLGQYVVFWASNLYPSGDLSVPRDEGANWNRMMYVTTRDFVTFTEPKVWIDERQPGAGNGTIDSTIMQEDGWYYRFTVTEGSNIPRVDRTKDLYETITPGDDPWLSSGTGNAWEPRQSGVGYGQWYTGTSGRSIMFDEGEGTTLFRPNKGDVNGDGGVYAFIDQAPYYGGDGYVPFKATSLAAGDWTIVQNRNLPKSARHGTVLPISVREYEAILGKYQPDRLIDAADVSLTTLPGSAPALPATVTAVQGRGTATEKNLGQVAVSWEKLDAAALKAGATVTVRGTVATSGFVEARIRVLDVVPAVSARCVASKVVLLSTVNNGEGTPVSIDLGTAYGSRSDRIGAGATSSASFSSRLGSVPAGTVTVKVTTEGSASAQVKVPYGAKTC